MKSITALLVTAVCAFFVLVFTLPATAEEIRFLPTACRIMDTRNTTVGQTASLSFFVRGLPGAVQGGEPGCGLPLQASAAVLNFIIAGPVGNGHAVIWPEGSTQPITSSLNFSANTNQNDGLLVRLPSTGLSADLRIQSSVPGYWIVDLVGWTEPSVSTLVGQAESYTGADLHIRTFSGQLITARPPLVPGFYNSWASQIGNSIGSCVNVAGFWTSPTAFEARSLPMVASGYCGPN